jgi:uncharacterized damage-inducible protein DinB
MQETPQQYIHRVLGYLGESNPLAVLTATPGQLTQLLAGIPEGEWSRRPGPDQWSITEILAHLADSELVYGFRIRLILEGGGPPIQSIDQDAWVRLTRYAEQDPTLSLDSIRINRERLVRLLERLPQESWERYGIHSERGKETVSQIVHLLAGHDLAHIKQIRERLAGR